MMRMQTWSFGMDVQKLQSFELQGLHPLTASGHRAGGYCPTPHRLTLCPRRVSLPTTRPRLTVPGILSVHFGHWAQQAVCKRRCQTYGRTCRCNLRCARHQPQQIFWTQCMVWQSKHILHG